MALRVDEDAAGLRMTRTMGTVSRLRTQAEKKTLTDDLQPRRTLLLLLTLFTRRQSRAHRTTSSPVLVRLLLQAARQPLLPRPQLLRASPEASPPHPRANLSASPPADSNTRPPQPLRVLARTRVKRLPNSPLLLNSRAPTAIPLARGLVPLAL